MINHRGFGRCSFQGQWYFSQRQTLEESLVEFDWIVGSLHGNGSKWSVWEIPSRCEDDFPFTQVGYVSFQEGIVFSHVNPGSINTPCLFDGGGSHSSDVSGHNQNRQVFSWIRWQYQDKSSKKQCHRFNQRFGDSAWWLVSQPDGWWFSLKGSLVGTVVVSVGLLGLFPPFSRVSGRCICKPLLEENSPYTTSCTLSIPGAFLWYPRFLLVKCG